MGWGNHHASYDEPCTQADALTFQYQMTQDARDRIDSITEEDRRRLRMWHERARDMTYTSAREFWYKLFPLYRIQGDYFGPRTPLFEDHWARRLPPTPTDRPVESPLWWATHPRDL
jgi:hypothetical protein